MKTSDFDYDLPPGMIAQTPAEPRDASRLLLLDRRSGDVHHAVFNQLGQHLRPGDLLVLNETRVIPARLFARKLPGGGHVELLLIRRVEPTLWEALVGGKNLRQGKRLQVDDGPAAEIAAELGGARRLVRFDEPIESCLAQAGHTPLPPYIHTPLEQPERYQTVYARQPGSVAAPTAGLHFTPRLMDELQAAGIGIARLTLHVGLDTFAPVTEENADEHRIHTEWCQVSETAARAVNDCRRRAGRVIAVGTTSVRTLESAGRAAAALAGPHGQIVVPFEGPTDLFILPGYEFRVVDGMLTNFHLPRSSLIMLVSAFAGREHVLAAYETAKRSGYRFYSFGDAMLIV